MFRNYPSGMIVPFAGATTPANFLACDGSSYLRADYPNLFSAIGTAFGSVDGTHFNVPDIRGRVPVGYDSSDANFDTVGETGGAKTINISHTHTTNNHTHTYSGTTGANTTSSQQSNDTTNSFSANGHTHTYSGTTGTQSVASTDSQLSSAQSILNPYMALNYIIRV